MTRAALLAALLAACGASDGGPDTSDGSQPDAGGPDASVPVDSSPADAADADADSSAADSGAPAASLELGTGDVAFEPMADGTLELVYGIQGGHHFDVSLRAFGIAPGNPEVRTDPDNPRTTYRAFTLDGTPVDDGGIEYAHAFLPGVEEGSYVLLGRRLILGVPCEEVVGTTLRIDATVEDSEGVRLVASEEVIPVATMPETCPAPGG